MATYQQERDEFIGLMVAEGVSVTTARKLLSAASTLQKLAELECSSERADRDRVPCPKRFRPTRTGGACLCDDYGSIQRPLRECLSDQCAEQWRSDEEGPCPKCGHSSMFKTAQRETRCGDVPRIAVQGARIEARVMALAGGKDYTAKTCPGRPCAEGCDHKTLPKFTPIFGGDPRGSVLAVKVPSGKYNSWGGSEGGICVPARGFSAAQMERICR